MLLRTQATGCEKVQLQKPQSTKLRFIARLDAFYPLDMYRRKFGDLKANKANGHFKTECNGVTSIIGPEDEPDEPWRVQREIVGSLDNRCDS
jgi:hypothetical protein